MTNPNKFHKDDLPNHEGMSAVTGACPEFNHLSDAQMLLLGTGGAGGGVRKDSETIIWDNVLKDWQVDFTPNFTTGVVVVLSDGFLLEYGEDFTVVGDIITFTLAPAKWTFIVEFFSSPIAAIYEDKDMLWDAVETVWDLAFEPDVGYPVVITRDGVECSLGTIAGGDDVELTGPAQLTFAQAPTSWTHIVNWKDAIPAGIDLHEGFPDLQGTGPEHIHLNQVEFDGMASSAPPGYTFETLQVVNNGVCSAEEYAVVGPTGDPQYAAYFNKYVCPGYIKGVEVLSKALIRDVNPTTTELALLINGISFSDSVIRIQPGSQYWYDAAGSFNVNRTMIALANAKIVSVVPSGGVNNDFIVNFTVNPGWISAVSSHRWGSTWTTILPDFIARLIY